MTLGLVTCLWGRPRLTRLFLAYWRGLTIPGVVLRRVAVASPEDAAPRKRAAGWRVIQHPNRYLSDKFNAGFQALRGQADAVMIVGSDDFCCTAYVAEAARRIRQGAGWVETDSLYLLDALSGRMCYFQNRHMGTARVFSARLLDALDWKPCPERDATVDGSTFARIQDVGSMHRRLGRKGRTGPLPALFQPSTISDLSGHNMMVLDVKTRVNKWPYEHFAARARRVDDPGPVLYRRLPAVADELLTWRYRR